MGMQNEHWKLTSGIKRGMFDGIRGTTLWVVEYYGVSLPKKIFWGGGLTVPGRYTFNAWVPLLAYPAQQAPNYKSGYKVNAGLWGIYLIGVPVILWFSKTYPSTTVVQSESNEDNSIPEPEHESKEVAENTITKEISP